MQTYNDPTIQELLDRSEEVVGQSRLIMSSARHVSQHLTGLLHRQEDRMARDASVADVSPSEGPFAD